MKQYSAKAVANAFLEIAQTEGAKIEPMKMQKLVYIAHGWALGLMNQPFITEDIQAWKYGPVIQDLYHEFKRYGRDYIVHKATNVSLDPKTLKIVEETPKLANDDTDAQALVRKVWEVYGKFSGPQLSNITHMPDTPWDITFNGEHQRVISNDVIRDHYQQLIQQRSQR
ncbi:DUF4065 domain-containing protein [Vibrio vulnificus]|nr:DUF4065 domain-containing protein [Vibrio vulnificus]